MGPTGSIFARSSRTRRGVRARLLALGAVLGTVMLAAAPAHADWRTDLHLVERPNDVLDMWGERDFAVGYTASSESGAYLFLGGVLFRTLSVNSSSESAGTYYDVADDCFVSVLRNGQGSRLLKGPGSASCAHFTVDNSSSTDPSADVKRVKHAVGGGAAALVTSPDSIVFLSNTLDVYDYSPLTLYSAPPVGLNGSFGVVRVEGKVYALAGESAGDSPVDWFWDNGGGGVSWERHVQSSTPMGVVQAIDAFAAGSPALPYAVVGTQQGFLQGSLRASPHPLRKVQDVGGSGVKSLSMSVGFGGTWGTGFGMAIVARPDGSFGVMSPVPMLSDTEAGTVWVDRTDSLPPELQTAPLKQVACWGAATCVLTADQAGTGNLFVYTNAARPEISVVAPAGSGVDTSGGEVVIDEGKAFTLSLKASDLDGDPVLVTAAPWSASSAQWSVTVPSTAATPGEPIQVTGTTGKLCQSRLSVGSLMVNAADGLLAHEAHASFPVSVRHTVPPSKPAVVRDDGHVLVDGESLALEAGGGVRTLRTSVADSGCTLLAHEWKPTFSPPPPGAQTPSLVTRVEAGSNVTDFMPPAVLCQAGGADFDYEYRVTDEGGLSSSHALEVHVSPWGKPNSVFSPATGNEDLSAGSSLTLTPASSRHACQGSPGFPGVETHWTVTRADGGALGPGISYDTDPTTQNLVLTAEHCTAPSTLRITGVNQLAVPAGASSEVSERQVTVQPDWASFESGSFTVDTRALPSDELLVRVDSPLDCKTERKLRAELTLTPTGGGSSQTTTGELPGEWRLPLGVGCQGGSFELTATMREDATGKSSTQMMPSVDVPKLAAKLEPLKSVLVARCGEGASATLTQTFPADACPSSAVSWSWKDGPRFDLTVLSRNTASLSTQEKGLDELVGRAVVVSVTATAGPGNEASILHELPITVEPFVKVRRRTEVPAASETGLVGVSVELLNTTACGVTGVSYVEHLEGLTYVEGSAKVDGQPVAATWKEGALTVSGLSLAGEGTGTLTYVARPHLVGERRMNGEASLRDVPISLSDAPGVQVPDSGCGCTSSGPGPVVFALGVLGAAVRRRRRP